MTRAVEILMPCRGIRAVVVVFPKQSLGGRKQFHGSFGRMCRSSMLAVGWPVKARMISPSSNPARCAELFFSTETTRIPLSAGSRWNRATRRGSGTFWPATPMYPRLIRPSLIRQLATNFAVLAAIAKQIPWAGRITAVFTPITSPHQLTSGPPELPGLRAASVWITLSINRPEVERSERPSALITHAVTVHWKPYGLPSIVAVRRQLLGGRNLTGEVAHSGYHKSTLLFPHQVQI